MPTCDARVRHLEVPRDVAGARTARAQLGVGDGDRTAPAAAAARRDHVTHVGDAAEVAEVDVDAPADAHPAVLRRPDIDALGGRAATGVEVLEHAVLAVGRLVCTHMQRLTPPASSNTYENLILVRESF